MHVQESRLRKSEQGDKWSFCLIAAIIVANRETMRWRRFPCYRRGRAMGIRGQAHRTSLALAERLCQADEAIVGRFARTIDLRRIDPAPTRLQHLNDPRMNPPIIDPWLAARIIRQKRLQQSERILVSRK